MEKSERLERELLTGLDRLVVNLRKFKKQKEVHDFLLESFEEKLLRYEVRYGMTESYHKHKNWYTSYMGIEEL